KSEAAAGLDGVSLERELTAKMGGTFTELAFAKLVTLWLEDEAAHTQDLDVALRYAAWAVHTAAGRARNRGGVLFKAPIKLDYYHLVPLVSDDAGGYRSHRLDHLRRRGGFKLTDAGTDLTGAMDQVNYCIWCHEQG